jgi:hypothetical protein
MPNRLLFVLVCSDAKSKGRDRSYDPSLGLLATLDDHSLREEILRRRQAVYQLLKTGELSRGGVPLRDLPYNADLADGKTSAVPRRPCSCQRPRGTWGASTGRWETAEPTSYPDSQS